MTLKYQKEIDNFGLGIVCPDNVKNVDSLESFRFSFIPITHELNFLPNVVFDRLNKSGINYSKLSSEKKCLRCGSSFYLSKQQAIDSWNNLSEQIRNNLKYTHLAFGYLGKDDGVVSEPAANGHFTFYESTEAELSKKFQIVEQL